VNETISTTEGAVLGLLASSGERSGYELAKRAEGGVAYLWTPSRSQIYKVLPRLVAAGLARMREVEQHGRPDKALYEVTQAGLDALRAWLEEVEEQPVGGRVVFALKVFLCDFASPATALRHLAAYRRFLERRLGAYEALEAGAGASPPGYPEHVLQHGLARVRATLAWIEETTAAIELDTPRTVSGEQNAATLSEMAKKRQTFGKLQRERERAEKRARKQEKKEEKKAAALAAEESEAAGEFGTGTAEEPSEPEELALPPEGAPEPGSSREPV
jgi:PadR family transcriptional regulator, regulatory protein AphA